MILFQIWDDELARVAQKHADQCVFQHDCAECRKIRKLSRLSRIDTSIFMRFSFVFLLCKGR